MPHFIHERKTKADSQVGDRCGVDIADLQTGNVEVGKQYFNGAGTCSSCHSPEGDLAGVATRYQGLKLEERTLYPSGAPAKITVTLGSGETVASTLAYRDESTVGLRDASGWYRSWPTSQVKYTIHAPAEAHADLLTKYTDADVHNLMAHLQTLREPRCSKGPISNEFFHSAFCLGAGAVLSLAPSGLFQHRDWTPRRFSIRHSELAWVSRGIIMDGVIAA